MFLNKSVISSLLLVFLLSACGGGDDFDLNGIDGSTGDTSETDTDTDTDGTGAVVSLALGTGSESGFSSGVVGTDIAENDVLSFGGNATFTVNVVDTNASNALYSTPTTVSFTSACAASGLATIVSSSDSSDGVAKVSYVATSCSGSDTIVATLTNGATAAVTISISSLTLGTGSGGSFNAGTLTTTTDGVDLSYGGDAAVTVNIVDSVDNELFTGPVSVSFTSNCVDNGFATMDSSANTSNGTATVAYSASTCEGTDTITATLSDGTSATTVINIADQILGSLEFVSATPTTIALKGSGSSANPEVSDITFILRDNTGAAIQGETVSYILSTEVGGITLSSDTSVTTADGTTSVTLNAGGVNVSVSVTASVTNNDGDTIITTSNPIAIVGGLPDQDSFSISVETLNPRGWDIDGTTSGITIRGADRFNNPAPDSTQVSFVTSGGVIVGSCALVGGVCSVNWTSQDPRPTSGLVRILARTTGEESFTDANSNGKYDIGDAILSNFGEAFLDINDDGLRTDDEFFSDFNGNGLFDSTGSALFQGTNCSADAEAAGHCANLIEVREPATICMSGDDVTTTFDKTVLDVSGGEDVVVVTFEDINGLIPALGTTISPTIENGEITGGGTVAIPNQCTEGFSWAIGVKDDENATTDSGTLTVKVGQLNGLIRTSKITLCHLGVASGACILLQPPTITLSGGNLVLALNSTYVEPGFTAADNVEDLTASVVVVSDVDTSVAGTYSVTYSVSNREGEDSVTRTVTVN